MWVRCCVAVSSVLLLFVVVVGLVRLVFVVCVCVWLGGRWCVFCWCAFCLRVGVCVGLVVVFVLLLLCGSRGLFLWFGRLVFVHGVLLWLHPPSLARWRACLLARLALLLAACGLPSPTPLVRFDSVMGFPCVFDRYSHHSIVMS